MRVLYKEGRGIVHRGLGDEADDAGGRIARGDQNNTLKHGASPSVPTAQTGHVEATMCPTISSHSPNGVFVTAAVLPECPEFLVKVGSQGKGGQRAVMCR